MNQCQIYREWNFIDILIKHPSFIVVIENKILTSDHSKQLQRYRNIIEKYFPNINSKVYVYLSPYGDAPVCTDESNNYLSISYRAILSNLIKLLDIYGSFMSVTVKNYIADYIDIIEEKIMQESNVIELVKKLYENHREVLDFIFENKPDRLLECAPIFKEIVKEKGYTYVGGNKGLCRFLPGDLVALIPKRGCPVNMACLMLEIVKRSSDFYGEIW